MLEHLRKHPADRLAEEVALMVASSAHFVYFENLCEFHEEVGRKLQFDVCQNMHLVHKKRGTAVINISSQ